MWDNKARAALAATFLDALKDDVIPWRKCWAAAPVSFSTGKPYRGINNLMLSFISGMKGYQDTRWLTFKQAQNNGWHVRKGERAVKVEYWHYYDTETMKNLDRAEVRRIQREEPERMKNIKLAAYTYNVFNAEQIEGIPPQEAAIPPCDIATLKSQRDTFLHNLGVGFREGGDRAYYSSRTDIITMPRAQYSNNDYSYMATLLHEAGHATGHSSRLNRPLGNEFASPEYAKEELRAEIASAFIAQTLHLPYQEANMAEGLEQHKAYVQSWIDSLENDPNELFAAIKDADKIADYLMERGQLQELTQVSTSPRLVGRIDFLSYNGEVGESQEYSDASKFIEAIKEENFYGVPMTIIIYKDLEGKHISTSFVQELDPLPQGLRFEQCPNEAENAEPPSREFQPTNDFELEL